MFRLEFGAANTNKKYNKYIYSRCSFFKVLVIKLLQCSLNHSPERVFEFRDLTAWYRGADYSYGAKRAIPLCNFLSPLANLPSLPLLVIFQFALPGNFPVCTLMTIYLSCILYRLSFHNHLEKIVDIYISTKSRKV